MKKSLMVTKFVVLLEFRDYRYMRYLIFSVLFGGFHFSAFVYFQLSEKWWSNQSEASEMLTPCRSDKSIYLGWVLISRKNSIGSELLGEIAHV